MKKLFGLLLALLFTANFTFTTACNVGYFDVVFNGVTNNYANCTSTWSYTVTGVHGDHDLSHWVLALCGDHKVIESNYNYTKGNDPKLNFYGIKWDVSVPSNGVSKVFTFVLDGIYSTTSVKVGIKAGQDLLYGFVTGPSCTPTPCAASKPITPILECVQPNGDGTYTAHFGYLNENPNAVTIPVGINNFFTPAPQNQNQTTVFQPGRSEYYPNSAFSVVFNGNDLKWTLKGPDGIVRTVTASKSFGICEEPEPSSLGNKVWLDINKNGIQDAGENGVAGVKVELYNCSGNYISEKTTNTNGEYLFDELVEGSYFVRFILPSGYVFSPADQGLNNELDSDPHIITGIIPCTDLEEGENDLSFDAGIYIPETEKSSDLSLVKTVDNNKPKSGDEINFTITVTNNGPDKATNVQVRDLLKTGFTFISADHEYDNLSGIWNVGDLNNGQSKSINIKVKVEAAEIHTTTFDLGIAKDFNLFILNDALMPSSDTQGRMAVGRNASLSNYSVGDQLNNPDGAVDVLVVGNHLEYSSGAVYGGNVVYGSSSNLPIHAVSVTSGVVKQGNPVDFAAAQTYLTNLSMDLSNYSVNGNTTMEWGGLKLNGANPILNVFKVSGSDLINANDFQISVPNGSVVLVNISGTDVKWTGGLKVNGTDIRNVLYNFYEASLITIQGIDVTGSILAPLAHVNFVSGVQNGQMIAKSLEGTGQFNYVMFMGNIPEESTLTNIAEVYAMDQRDPDSTPANGSINEDDYSSVTIIVNGQESEGNNDDGDDDSGNWEPTGNSSLTDMIWSLVSYNDHLYAGTVGGKIFKSNDNGATWVRINNDMSVSWIWAIAIDNNKFYAATEQGIYSSVDGVNWTLSGLNGTDVRALELVNGNIYAGTWGFGVYVSADQGQTWTAMNTDLSCLAVHALAMNSRGDLFAGTFGGGVFKYAAGKWDKLDVGYEHVWALGITSTDKIYAGTLGGGVYQSSNDGTTWSTLNDGLPVQFVYAITIDASDNVYLNTWAGGIYGLSSQTNEWFSTGMAGQGVTAVAASMTSATLYLGTENGMIYQSVKSLTNTDDKNNTLPDEFALGQNYPNPFNPSTMIQFSIPVAGNYSIRVYNALGQMVETLADNNFEAGVHTIQFNAGRLSSGVYIYRLVGENVSISRKMLLTK